MLGYIIGVSTMSVGGRYVAMFLMASGYAGQSHYTLILGAWLTYLTRFRPNIGMDVQRNPAATGEALCCYGHREWVRQPRKLVRPTISVPATRINYLH